MSNTENLAILLGGIILLLWGTRMIRTGAIRGFGTGLHKVIGRCAANRFYAAIAGTLVGTTLQSSTATALLVSPFVAQGVLTTAMALAIMLGADLGASLAATLFSSGIARAWPLLALAGYILHLTYDGRNVRLKNIGRVLIGLGILLLGLRMLGSAAGNLAASPVVSDVISAASSEVTLAVLLGAALTWMAYSSMAIILLAVTLAGQGGIPAEHLYSLVLGVNLGAALPALSAMAGQSIAPRRIPIGNLMFRLIGVLLMIPLVDLAADFIKTLAANQGHRILIFHVSFNILLCILLLSFTGTAAKFLRWLLPDTKKDEAAHGPRYLDEALLATPSAALGAASRETLRMGEIVEDMLAKTMQVFEADDPALRAAVEAADDDVDELNEAVKLYLTRLMRGPLGNADSARAVDIITFTTNLEHVGDIIDKNLMELAVKKRTQRLQFSKTGLEELRNMHARVMDTLHLALNVFTSGRPDSARMLIARKTELRNLELEGTQKHIERLSSGQSESILTSAIHLDVIRDFKRINSHLTSVAYPVLERAGELRNTRLKKKAEREMQTTLQTKNA